jgi:hypothetical protein
MTITSFHVQNILRTYARQLSRGQRLARNRAANQATQNDQVNISIEARRKQVIEKITSEIVSSIGSRVPGMAQGMGGLEEQALQQLSKEYGKHLDIYQDAGSGQLMFRVVEDQNRESCGKFGCREIGGAARALVSDHPEHCRFQYGLTHLLGREGQS